MVAAAQLKQSLVNLQREFGGWPDIWSLRITPPKEGVVSRISAFSRLLTIDEIETKVDGASRQQVNEYRQRFTCFFSCLFHERKCFLLSNRWLFDPRFLQRQGPAHSSEDPLESLSRKLIGPLSRRHLISLRKRSAILSALTESAGALLVFDEGRAFVRGHDDFGCLLVSRRSQDHNDLNGWADDCGLFMIRKRMSGSV
jgi:hypothetical protein